MHFSRKQPVLILHTFFQYNDSHVLLLALILILKKCPAGPGLFWVRSPGSQDVSSRSDTCCSKLFRKLSDRFENGSQLTNILAVFVVARLTITLMQVNIFSIGYANHFHCVIVVGGAFSLFWLASVALALYEYVQLFKQHKLVIEYLLHNLYKKLFNDFTC